MKTLLLKNGQAAIQSAAELLKKGEVVALPTETVYGLAANAFDKNAIKKIFEAKGRPQDNPLIVHISSPEDAEKIAFDIPEKAYELFKKFSPGPLTVILKKKDVIPDEVSAGLKTVAVRIPSHPVARAVIREAGVPLAAPSANISGFPSPTNAVDVSDDMNGRIAAIIDGGECECGIESTVVSLVSSPPRLLRPGVITADQLKSVLGELEIDSAVLNPLKEGETAASPGMKYTHYSPRADISVVSGDRDEFFRYLKSHGDEADFALIFEEDAPFCPVKYVTFGRENEPLTQSGRLFAALRELDRAGAKSVFARDPSKKGVGLGVCNRLYRAAGFKILNKKKIIGICGQTGAGKSTVCGLLKENGAQIIDTDKIAREIVLPGSPVLKALAKSFGNDIINSDGSLNRALLAKRAFENKQSASLLSSITHPAIIEISRERAETAISEKKTAVIDAPLLFSSGMDKLCDLTVKVVSPEETRLERIMMRDNISPEEAKKRIAVQEEEDILSNSADIIIKNYPPYSLEEQLKKYNII
ncbi:MAG: threonylcarbamoyl-AMP synthase [Oscillospiraceae bacterium]|nr:threonylcarbamoyl-AMP synthase [Oscillospiraceae bacterium]